MELSSLVGYSRIPMSDPDTPTDDKYITFKKQDLMEWLGEMSTLDWSKRESPMFVADINAMALHDAVVIRRQDKFASPCLLTYASMIGLVGDNHPDPKVRADLLDIADYFQRQGELAGDEAYKLPDL